jgi:hypothetical protein
MKAFLRSAAVMAGICMAATPAYAQNLNTGATGTHGQVRLTAGFEPDPHSVTVNAGGAIEATRADEACNAGFIAQRPTYSLRYTSGDFPLFIYAQSEADTTLAVRTPSGSWVCDDDSGGNLNPLVSFQTPERGRYQIWVGRFGTEGETASAVLSISEVGAPEQAVGAGAPDFSLEPAYGAVELAAGFIPDPHSVEIAAGGALDASQLGGTCVGWVAQAPDFRVNWTASETSQLPLTFHVTAETDTVLVINDAEGNWVCNDDTDGINPVVSFQGAVSGQYDVWVGTYSQGDLQPSTLHVTEVYGMGAE